MGLLSSFLGILGFGIGICGGLLVGFFLFIYRESDEVKDPVIRPLNELETSALEEIMPEIPMWVKTPDYDRVDWLNKFILQMWPYLNKVGVCSVIRSMAQPIFMQYIGKYHIEAIEFESLSLGTLPPNIYGMKVYETNEKELVMEPAFRWAGNPNIVLTIKLFSRRLTIQLVDLQIFASPRITLKPLVPTFPCFANIVVSLMEKPHVDFGLKILGADIMSIPGVYRFVQETIKKQVANLYLWPHTLEIPILDASTVAVKKPVGILHVKVVRALKLLKMDILGTSDPYVKLSFSGERLPPKRTTIKMKNLNPEWNEKFRLIVKDPQLQALELQVYDWDKVGGHDRLGMQLVPLKLLTPNTTKEFTLDLVKNTNVNDPQNRKRRGQLVVELTYVPFRTDSINIHENGDGYESMENGNARTSDEGAFGGAGVLLVTIQGAEDVEGEHHSNPYALILFRGEKRKTKMMKKTHDPTWNEEFQFMLEEPPLQEKIHIEVLSKRAGIHLRSKESLGYIDINLSDVLHNGRINNKYHLIDSKNGKIHVELSWKMA
ncbi:Synaptotagmin-like mitochondrial-lipid-binding domain containing protein [Trema orientale]|uniref:Synaptotagmin-like mitochondrial-lipid-binding domain containing protein n=1 Tax=Trema orientale TaxID=63057 RepID=A0A2P5D413_TREOI|nr:Synaptotagmin-like mitochondrial-lipid-binding domain containing protein [Trema orientale]